MKTKLSILLTLSLTSFSFTNRAQEIIIPDPGLNAAVRDTLHKPDGPLTKQDLLNLTFLNAHDRNISNLAGLEAAYNLNTLLLFSNHLTDFSPCTDEPCVAQSQRKFAHQRVVAAGSEEPVLAYNRGQPASPTHFASRPTHAGRA